MSQIKQLASQTAIYGLSTIIARFINFFFVPIYTRVLNPGNYGLATELLAYIALLQVVLTFGLETGFFRYANKDKENASKLFSTTITWMLMSLGGFLLILYLLSGTISTSMDHPVPYIRYVGWILVIDCFTALYFARLRFANKAWLFALYKSVKILSEVGFNLILFFFIPSYLTGHPDSMLLNFIPAQPDYGYILFAILLSGIVSLFLFIPQIIRTKIQFKKEQWKQIMLYSLPLMIAGLPGVANDYVDRILFRYFSPSGTSWLDQLGIYSAVTKLAVFITLFVQMFRYAAEPFFFASSENENIKITYARVMKYFVAFCMVLFLGIAFYADIFALILGKEYRGGMGVLPLVLMANILLGVTFNLSMWYKMSDKTQYAIYITLLGLAVTVVLNIVFMPVYGYWAAAWSRLLSYVVMIFFSYLLSIRNFPIPYDLRSIFTYFVVGIGLFGLSLVPSQQPVWIRLTINSILMMSFIVFIFRYEHLKPGMIVEVKKIVIRKKAGNKHGS